jgi:hypothetical protein
MKKVLLGLFVGLVLLWNWGTVLAQGKNENAAAGGKRERIRRELRAPSGVDEPNDPRRQAGQERMKQREKARELGRQAREKRREEMMKVREKSLAERGKAGYGADANRPGGAARGKDHAQQLKALEQQLTQIEQKHLERVAKLNRIRELAVKKDAKDVVGRVDKLLQKEQRLHGRKQERMQTRMSKFRRLEEGKSGRGVPGEESLPPETRKMMGKNQRMPKTRPIPGGKEPEAGEKSGQ